MLHGFVPSRGSPNANPHQQPISPLYAPLNDISSLYGSCSPATYQVVSDMRDLTCTFIARWNYTGDLFSPATQAQFASYDAHMQQIYTRLLMSHSTEDDITPDWMYECCRLAALIYCRSIVQGVPLPESAHVLHARNSGAIVTQTTLISALHSALERTDRKGCWGDMWGVLLWVTLVGGAASWPESPSYRMSGENEAFSAWMRKCFALYSVCASFSSGFEHASGVVEAQRMMLQVQQLIDLKRGASPR